MADTAEQLTTWQSDMARFERVYRSLPPIVVDQLIDGGWSPRQLLVHLLDAELVFSVRLRTAIAEPGNPVQAFDPDAWADNRSTGGIPDDRLLDSLTALRSVNMALLRALPPAAWDQTVQHPEAGAQSLSRIVEVFGNHVGAHLTDLEKVASPR